MSFFSAIGDFFVGIGKGLETSGLAVADGITGRQIKSLDKLTRDTSDEAGKAFINGGDEFIKSDTATDVLNLLGAAAKVVEGVGKTTDGLDASEEFEQAWENFSNTMHKTTQDNCKGSISKTPSACMGWQASQKALKMIQEDQKAQAKIDKFLKENPVVSEALKKVHANDNIKNKMHKDHYAILTHLKNKIDQIEQNKISIDNEDKWDKYAKFNNGVLTFTCNERFEIISKVPQKYEGKITEIKFDNPKYLIRIGQSSRGWGVFDNEKNITKLDLSNCENLISSGDRAFENSPIIDLLLPKNILVIGDNCFKNSKLNKLDLSNFKKLGYIGYDAFEASPLNEIKLPRNLKAWYKNSFSSSLSSVKIYVNQVAWYLVRENISEVFNNSITKNNFVIFDENKKITIDSKNWENYCYFKNGLLTFTTKYNYEILRIPTNIQKQVSEIKFLFPQLLNKINAYSCDNMNILKSLSFRKCINLTEIGPSAFKDAPLTKLNFYNTNKLSKIEQSAFYNAKLKSLILDSNENLTIIDAWAFKNSLISYLKLPSSLTTIGPGSFENSTIRRIDLSKNINLEFIGQEAFKNSQLFELDLSNCVKLKKIDAWAFENSNLRKLILPKGFNFQAIAFKKDIKPSFK